MHLKHYWSLQMLRLTGPGSRYVGHISLSVYVFSGHSGNIGIPY